MSNQVYKTIEITGTSDGDMNEAIRHGVESASATVRNLDWFEVTAIRGHIEDGSVRHTQVTMKLGFRLE